MNMKRKRTLSWQPGTSLTKVGSMLAAFFLYQWRIIFFHHSDRFQRLSDRSFDLECNLARGTA